MFSKAKIIVICGLLVLSALAGLIIKISLNNLHPKTEQIPANAIRLKDNSSLKNPALKFPLADGRLKGLNIPKLPIPKPNLNDISKEKSLPGTVAPFFDDINKAAKAVEKSLTAASAPTQSISTTTSSGIVLFLTKDQFHFLYPDKFIAGLADAQNLFIEENDPDYEPILNIETDSQVRFIEEKIVTTLLSENIITKDRAEQFITTIRFTLPQLQLTDLKRYGSYGFYGSSPLSKFVNSALGTTDPPAMASKNLFLSDLMDKLADILAHKAQAYCGYCYSLTECFQEGAATPNAPGPEVVKFSCYCTGCLKSLGCLSSYDGQAAIYDQTTGICGAGL